MSVSVWLCSPSRFYGFFDPAAAPVGAAHDVPSPHRPQRFSQNRTGSSIGITGGAGEFATSSRVLGGTRSLPCVPLAYSSLDRTSLGV